MIAPALCIHGHFYQPPREDPLTGIIPPEPGAAPLHDWNERIHAECYRPNAESGNFEHLSFNFGPTLMRWMAEHDEPTYRRIIAHDQANVRHFGVGNAIAQAYNHTILPLASYADKVTQVAWGIGDFTARFGRRPQGLWLPETAVDTETLTVLADFGVEFTILAPWQADCDNLDTGEPYRVALPGGRSIVVFFYHQDLSGRMSFDPGMTVNADSFVRHDLVSRYRADLARRDTPPLVLVASDGELYGHHQPFRDQFLAYLLRTASRQAGITPTFPARWLREHPPRRFISIRERTSWSCHHGVERWRSACDCAPVGDWKAQMRAAIDRIGADVTRLYAEHAGAVVGDVWALRNGYIEVMLGQVSAEEFIQAQAGQRLREATLRRVVLLLEAQREMQRAYTSCGWFFDDFDRIEPQNNVRYAAQAVWLTRQATGVDLAPSALAALRRVVSPRTSRRADQVFARHLWRAENH